MALSFRTWAKISLAVATIMTGYKGYEKLKSKGTGAEVPMVVVDAKTGLEDFISFFGAREVAESSIDPLHARITAVDQMVNLTNSSCRRVLCKVQSFKLKLIYQLREALYYILPAFALVLPGQGGGVLPFILDGIGSVAFVYYAIGQSISFGKLKQLFGKIRLISLFPIKNKLLKHGSQMGSGHQVAPAANTGQMQAPVVAPMIQAVPAGSVAQPAIQTGAQPTISGGAQPAIQAIAQPAIPAGAQPAIQAIAQPAIHTGAQPAIHAGTQPVIHVGAQPAIHDGAYGVVSASRGPRAPLQEEGEGAGPSSGGSSASHRQTESEVDTRPKKEVRFSEVTYNDGQPSRLGVRDTQRRHPWPTRRTSESSAMVVNARQTRSTRGFPTGAHP